MPYQISSKKFLSSDELKSLLESLNRYKNSDQKKVAALELALVTGARAEELVSIKRDDLNYEAKSVLIHGIKRSRDREIPIHADLFNRLLTASDDPEYIFNFDTQRLRDIWYEYRPAGCKKPLHALRHTFAVELYKRTKDIKLVQLTLGHVSLTSTNVYADFVYSINEMRRALFTPYSPDSTQEIKRPDLFELEKRTGDQS